MSCTRRNIALRTSTVSPRRSSTTASLAPGAAALSAAVSASAAAPAFSHSSTRLESIERTTTRSQAMMSRSCSSRFSNGTVRDNARYASDRYRSSVPSERAML